jgi:CDP-glycerol glycerophosphotransferase
MGEPGPGAPPIVSVIIPVWDTEPFLAECLGSVVAQSIGLDRMEVIAIDDGSTDGSGALLDAWAVRYPQITVVHEPNSGGPGRPRNVGLDLARGTFVFFLDADDYLGREALERLVEMAERNDTDIVLARMVGFDGRRVPTPFREDIDHAELPDVYPTLTALKLFRRSLIEGLGLRFEEGLSGHEDGPFTAHAYFHAKGISVLAGYPAYHVRPKRHTRAPVDLRKRLANTIERIDLLVDHTEPGPVRERLMARHVADVARPFDNTWLALEPERRRQVFDTAADLVRRWNTESIQRDLDPARALRTHCLGHGLALELEDIVACPSERAYGDPIVEGDRVFARFPHFRDAAGIPDRWFELTGRITPQRRVTSATVDDGRLDLSGEAYLKYLGGSTTVVLRRWPSGPSYDVATRAIPTPLLSDRHVPYPSAGFEAAIDLDTVADGRAIGPGWWDLVLSVGTDAVRRTAFVRADGLAEPIDRDMAATGSPPAALAVGPGGRLRLRVDPVPGHVRLLAQADRVLRRLRRRR